MRNMSVPPTEQIFKCLFFIIEIDFGKCCVLICASVSRQHDNTHRNEDWWLIMIRSIMITVTTLTLTTRVAVIVAVDKGPHGKHLITALIDKCGNKQCIAVYFTGTWLQTGHGVHVDPCPSLCLTGEVVNVMDQTPEECFDDRIVSFFLEAITGVCSVWASVWWKKTTLTPKLLYCDHQYVLTGNLTVTASHPLLPKQLYDKPHIRWYLTLL